MIQEASRCEFAPILIDRSTALRDVVARIATASCICKDCDGPGNLRRSLDFKCMCEFDRSNNHCAEAVQVYEVGGPD
jgi:hypothetical protein